jgi:hypothetical protein
MGKKQPIAEMRYIATTEPTAKLRDAIFPDFSKYRATKKRLPKTTIMSGLASGPTLPHLHGIKSSQNTAGESPQHVAPLLFILHPLPASRLLLPPGSP